MKKFFRIEWEGEDDIDENEVSIALSSWFDRHYDARNPPIEEIEAFEISDKVFEEKPKKIVEEVDLTRVFDKDKWIHFGKTEITLCNDFIHWSFDYKELFDIICKKKTGYSSKPKVEKLDWAGKNFPQRDYVVDSFVRALVELKKKQDELIEVVNR